MKYLLAIILAGFTFGAQAEIYNHGDHNDPVVTYFSGAKTINCGSLSLSACSNMGAIESDLNNTCDNKVTAAYRFRYVRTWATDVAITYVTAPKPFSLQVDYSCKAIDHQLIALPSELSF